MIDNEHAPFVRAVCDTPFDDLPRLVYADWLEERGDANRAEFIRAQCAFPRAFQMAPMEDGLPYGVTGWLQRGFVCKIECTLLQFMGARCGTCYAIPGVLTDGSGGSRRPCPDCNSTGRTTGLVDMLFREQPVTEVVLSDVPIHASSVNMVLRYFIGDAVGRTERMPLYGDYFDTRQQAMQAISRWAVALGRKRANLSALTFV